MKVIDISKHQASFNPATAKAAGVEAVLVRLAYGQSRDKLATGWADGIKKAGLQLGGYGFATWHYKSVCDGDIYKARQAMRKQVTAWIEIAKDIGLGWWFAIDQELEKDEKMALGMDVNTTLLAEASEMIRAAGFKPCLYCNPNWDFSFIRTTGLPGDLPYWFAYYGSAVRAGGFDNATLDKLPAGQYSRWMQKLNANGRLCGWQYGSTGMGKVLGCGSENVDRSIFYFEPEEAVDTGVELHSVTTGEMSAGDLEAVVAVLEARQIAYTVSE